MNANDLSVLAALLRGANVTINFHSGNGDINSHNGQEQHNHHNAAPERKRISQPLYTYRCESCGYASHNRADFFALGGYGNWSYLCNDCSHKTHLSAWEVLPSHETSAQIAAPEQAIVIDEPRQSYIDEIMQRDTGDYEQMQRDAAALRADELEMMRGWLAEIKRE